MNGWRFKKLLSKIVEVKKNRDKFANPDLIIRWLERLIEKE